MLQEKFRGTVIAILMFVMVAGLALAGGESEGNGEQQTISFLTLDAVNFRGALEEFIEEFEAAYPNVTVEADFSGSLGSQVRAGFESGTEPDIVFMWSGGLINYVEDQRVAPFPADVEARMRDAIYDYALLPAENEGRLYALPYNYYPSFGQVLYNTALTNAAGVDPSDASTWDELMEMAQDLTVRDDSGRIVQAGFSAERDPDAYFMSWVLQAGGKIFNEDGTAAFNNEIGREALQRYVDIYERWEVDSPEFGLTTDEFKKGTVAMTNGMPWYASIVQKDTPDIQFDFADTPTIDGAEPYWPFFEVWMHVVSPNAAEKEAVWDFLEFIAEPERAARFSGFSGEISAVKDAVDEPQLAENEILAPFLPLMPYGVAEGVVTWLSGDVVEVLRETMPQSVIFGQATVDEAIEAAAAEINRINSRRN